MVDPWVLPPAWTIPRMWQGERCFVICSGESVGQQLGIIKQLRGRIIAVKHGVLARPDADVLFLSGEGNSELSLKLISLYSGPLVIVRSKVDSSYPEYVKRVTRTKDHGKLCDLPGHVCGYDAGTSAINVAYAAGATELVLIGYDMRGGHFCKHPLQNPPQDHFTRHMEPLHDLNADAKRKGIRIVNCSPISAVTAFEKQPLEAFL